MSLLSICREAAAEVGVSAPASIIGNGETTAVRLLAAAKREVFGLSRSAAWSALVKEHSFATTTGASAQTGGLPEDFDYVIDATAWDRTAGRPLEGPLTAQAWQSLKASAAAPALGRAFRIFGGEFHLYPTPTTAGDEIAYEYASATIVTAAGGGGQSGWLADDDSFVLSEELATMGVKWRFKKAIGLAYDDDLNEYLSVLARTIARDGGRATLRLDGPAGLGLPRLPDGDFPES